MRLIFGQHTRRKILRIFEKLFMNSSLGVAKHLYEKYYPKPLEIICFHCQQSAEKSVKAIIVLNGSQGGMPKKHNIDMLLNQIKNMVDVDEKYYDYSDIL